MAIHWVCVRFCRDLLKKIALSFKMVLRPIFQLNRREKVSKLGVVCMCVSFIILSKSPTKTMLVCQPLSWFQFIPSVRLSRHSSWSWSLTLVWCCQLWLAAKQLRLQSTCPVKCCCLLLSACIPQHHSASDCNNFVKHHQRLLFYMPA